MAEHVNFKVNTIKQIKQLSDNMINLLSDRKTTIGIKYIQQFLCDLNKAMDDGIDGEIDISFTSNVFTPQSRSDSSQESVITQKPFEDKESIESRVARIEIQTNRIEKMVENLIKPVNNSHVSTKNNNHIQSSSDFPVKRCFICQKRGHLSFNCWFNTRYNNFGHKFPNQFRPQNHFRRQFHYNRNNNFLDQNFKTYPKPRNWGQDWVQRPPNSQPLHQTFKNLGTSYQN